jgi:hypothetical protein
MTKNLREGVRRATTTLLEKPGLRPDLTRRETEQIFHVAMAWQTYRTLNTLGLSPRATQAWIADYYHRMLLDI